MDGEIMGFVATNGLHIMCQEKVGVSWKVHLPNVDKNILANKMIKNVSIP